MGLFKNFVICLLPLVSLTASQNSDPKTYALYMMQNADIDKALRSYQDYTKESGRQDFEVLQQMGLVLFRQGIQSEDPDTFSMTLFGAGLSGSVGALEILERGLTYPDPQIQMIALHFISQIEDDRTDELLNHAMSSDFLSTRMEAAFHMARKKHPKAVGQIEGLMFRLPPMFRPYFPSLFALIGTSDSTAALRRLLDDLDPNVRIESILNIARLGRDDMLPILRKQLTHSNVAEQEACAYAMGALKDTSSLKMLKRLAKSPSENVKIAAILSLQELGDRISIPDLEELAKGNNIYAISALGNVTGSEKTLSTLVKSNDLAVRLNAAVSLLQLRDAQCLPELEEILISDQRGFAFYPMPSVGRSMIIWKAVPSAELRSKDPTLDFSLSISMREHILREAIYLPQEDFLKLAKHLIDKQQNDLIPTLISLLENLHSPEAIDLLKEGCTHHNSPLIRDYCHLALFRLKEDGPYEEHIKHWILHQKEAELIRLRPMLPWKMRIESEYALTPEETSRLLIESFLAIAANHNIDFLVQAIKEGNPQNRYALFGLLMRATE